MAESDQKPTSSSAVPPATSPEKNFLPEAMALVLKGKQPPNLSTIGEIRFPEGSQEKDWCDEIQSILQEYANRKKASRPLSIAVFGPPGSGKSFYVPQILAPAEEIMGCKHRLVNISQLADPTELAQVFHEAIVEKNAAGRKKGPRRKKDAGTRIFFFDEFDASLNGISLGWLRWFLAPMQDGKFFHKSVEEVIGKAIFMFAGGTASTLKEFDERARLDPAGYHDKKVPDFISRLRGFIDIGGINNPDHERPLLRALVLKRKLNERWPELAKDGPFPIERGLLKSLLTNAHYVHGVRSMEAVLDMSRLGNDKVFAQKHLPKPALKVLHLSRGPLDGKRICVSAGLDEKKEKFLIKLSERLFQSGANLVYGGNPLAPSKQLERGTLASMVEAANKIPDELIDRSEKQRIRNYLGYPAYIDPDTKDLRESFKNQVNICKLSTLSASECEDLNVPHEGRTPEMPEKDYFGARPREEKNEVEYFPKHHLAWSISLFRMRVRMIQDSDALIALGGKDGQSWGRFSGIAEEVMLALAMHKPVYVLGKAGGAALAIGKLLGLDETLVNPDTCLADIGSIEHSPLYKHYRHAFVLPEQPNLPMTVAEVRGFLFEHGVTSSTWRWNGLTPEQNRQLFNAELTEKDCINVIIEGLMRLDWKPAPGSAENKGMKRAKNAAP